MDSSFYLPWPPEYSIPWYLPVVCIVQGKVKIVGEGKVFIFFVETMTIHLLHVLCFLVLGYSTTGRMSVHQQPPTFTRALEMSKSMGQSLNHSGSGHSAESHQPPAGEFSPNDGCFMVAGVFGQVPTGPSIGFEGHRTPQEQWYWHFRHKDTHPSPELRSSWKNTL